MVTKVRKREPQGVRTIDLGLNLLDLLVRAGASMTLAELAAAAGFSPNKADRYLRSFKDSGLLIQDGETGGYDLGPAAALVGLAAQHRIDEFRLVEDALRQLTQRTGATASAVVWGNHGPTIIRRIEAARAVTVTTRVGSVIPITRSSSGIIYATFLASEVVEPKIEAEINSMSMTLRAKADARSRLKEKIAEVRRYGLATVEGDFVPGVDAIAGPVFGPMGEVWVSLAILGPHGSLDLSPTGASKAAVLEVTKALSLRVGYGA